MAEFTKKVCETFIDSVTKAYDLDEDFITSLREKLNEAIQQVGVPSGRGRGGAKTTRRRKKKSGYNVFVREMMADEEIKALDHRKKMSAIGARWKSLDKEQKDEYNDMATQENATNEAAEATPEVSTEAQ